MTACGDSNFWRDFVSNIMTRADGDINLVADSLTIVGFSSLFRKIFESKSGTTILQQMQQILLGYRVFANHFGCSLPSLSSKRYETVVVEAVWEILAAPECDQSVIDAVAESIELFSDSYCSKFLDRGRLFVERLQILLDRVAVSWEIRAFRAYLAFLAKLASPHEFVVVEKSVSSLISKGATTAIVDSILANSRIPESLLRCLTESMPQSSIQILLLRVSSLWANVSFIECGDGQILDYFTKCICFCFKRLVDDAISKTSAFGVISNGISAYLECSDKRRRRSGMLVAVAFARSLGRELSFPELTEPTSPIFPPKVSEHGTEHGTNSDIGCVAIGNLVLADSSSSDSSDSELEAYEDNHGISRFQGYFFLSKCLSVLQSSQNDKATQRDSWEVALQSIPPILLSHPMDVDEISGPLMQALIEFVVPAESKAMHTDAIVSLLIASPIVAVASLTDSLVSQSLSIGTKLELLAFLCLSAFQLAENCHDQSDRQGINEISGRYAIDKTKYKAPRKLALRSKIISSSANKFGPVAHLYYFPVKALVWSTIADTPTVDNRFSHEFNFSELKHLTSEPIMNECGIAKVLLAKAIVSLAAFVQCARNTSVQRELAIDLYGFVFGLVQKFRSDELRRASLSALLEVVKVLNNDSDREYSLDALAQWVIASLGRECDEDCRILELEILKSFTR